MRVLITRSHKQAEATARRLEALGHEPLVEPLFTIKQTGAPPPAGAFGAIIVTSANAIPALAALPEVTKRASLFAVGERTKRLLGEAGFPDVRAGEGGAVDLARLIAQTVSPAGRVLHVAGRDHKPEPHAALAAAGFSVQTWIAYEAVAADALPGPLARALAQDALEAALHYSRRSVETLLRLATTAGLARNLLSLQHACLSEDVAAPLVEAAAERVVIAERPDEASLLAALAL